EDFNYLKWAVMVVALLWIGLRDRWLPAVLWAIVFAMILIDDSFQLHEGFGERISVELNLQSAFFLFGNDFGEILVFLAMGAIALILTVVLLFRSSRETGKISARYYGVLLGLGFFGVGIDAIHQVITHILESKGGGTLFSSVFALLEDGGEMLVASYALALTLAPPAYTIFDRLARRGSSPGSPADPDLG
ncbi:MAG: hypothetical protein JNK19_02340, partial [Tabrizicola sp.]|nr:hypothetical protein [Tabrizicola sp.]